MRSYFRNNRAQNRATLPLAVWLAVVVQWLALCAGAQPMWPCALVVKHGIDLRGNGVYVDSYDSSDPVKSNNGRYDPSRYSGNFGNITTTGGMVDEVNVANASIYGVVHTGPNCWVSIGSLGGVGPHGMQVNDVATALLSGYIIQDANVRFPNTTLPDTGGWLPPQFGCIASTNYGVTTNLMTSTNCPSPSPLGGVLTNVNCMTVSVCPDPVPPGTLTNTTYTTLINVPDPVPPGLVTNILTISTNTVDYPAPGTYVGTVISNPPPPRKAHSYTYDFIIGYDYTYPVSTYTYPAFTYTYAVYQTNTIYATNCYDHVLYDNQKYAAASLAGQTLVAGSNVTLVLPNGLTGAESFSFSPGGAVSVFAGGSSVAISGNQLLNTYPGSFVLYCAPSVTSLTLYGNGEFAGVLVAPNADVTLRSGGIANDFSGAILANSLRLNGSFALHYDEALGRGVSLLPSITAQPHDQTVLAGQNATFSVTATGSGPLSYQWMVEPNHSPWLGPSVIPGATNSTLTLTNVNVGDIGIVSPYEYPTAFYFAVVSNAFGSLSSYPALLTVHFPPSIGGEPASQMALACSDLTLGVEYGFASPPLTFQWRFNGADLAGATNCVLTIPNMQSNNVGNYEVVLSNPYGCVTSLTATVGITIGPDFLWAQAIVTGATNQSLGMSDVSFASGIALDASRDVVLGGMFSGQELSFGATVLTNEQFAASSMDGANFLCKYDETGSLAFARWLGVTPVKLIDGAMCWSSTRVVANTAGGIYVAGRFSGAADFGGTTLNSQGPSDFFVAKYSNFGGLIWVRQITADWTNGWGDFGFAVDARSQVVLNSPCAGSAVFEGLQLTNIGAFMAKYDSSGTLLWARESFSGETLATGTNCDIYLADGALGAGVLAKYDSSGDLLWSKAFPHALGLAVDDHDNLYTTGYGAGTYDGLALTNCGGLPDCFVAKCDSSGQVLWLRQLGSTREQSGRGIALDQAGGVYVIGSSREDAAEPVLSVGATIMTNVTAFVAEYDTVGNGLWAKALGTAASVSPVGISVAGPAAIYVAGFFEQPASVGGFPLVNPNPDSWLDVFLAKVAGIGQPQLGAPLCSGGNTFQFSVDGAAGFRCVVEGSTNLIDWVPLVTNGLPFTFVDGEAANYPRRYYRTVYVP